MYIFLNFEWNTDKNILISSFRILEQERVPVI